MNMLLQRILITIILCILFAYFFGRVSLEKFYQESVVVTHQQMKTNSINPPVIGILPKQESGLGWKVTPKETDKFNSTNTIEDYGYTLDEITNGTFYANFSVRGHFVNGFCYFLEVKENLIKFDPDKTLVVHLNPNLSYFFLLSDKHNRFISPNPLSFVKTFFPISQNSGEIIVYLKTIMYKKLNRNNYECEESEEYNFSFCIEKKIIDIIGCQPYWMNLAGKDDIRLCETFAEHTSFVTLYMYYSQQPREKLTKETKCLRPCKYYEYKLAENPILVRFGGSNSNDTKITLLHASDTIYIEQEELAYPLETLIADCGGVLGLFIGFNFLIVWDYLMKLIERFCKRD